MPEGKFLSNNRSTTTQELAPVTVLFCEPAITFLFSELLRSRGIETAIAEDVTEIQPTAKVITEPRYYSGLPESVRSQCLVVGNKDALKSVDALSLSRPLTEEKIETALSRFLA